jgi:hypothetical protein
MLQAEKLLPAIISDSSEHQYFLLYLEFPLTSKKGTTMFSVVLLTKPGNRVSFFILRF